MIDNITQDNLHLSCRAKNKAEVLAMIGADFKARVMSVKIAWPFLLKESARSPPF